MIEVEIKIPIDNKITIIDKLKNIGFVFNNTIIQKDVYFQHPIRNFAKTDEALRIRNTSEGTFLNYKGPKLDETTKTREEIEIIINDNKNLSLIFEKLGFTKVILIEKTRDIYYRNKITVSIDTVKSLGTYLELEILVDKEIEIPQNRNQLLQILDELEIARDLIIRKSYLELLLNI